MSDVGSEQNPIRAAIIGSGPSGFYAMEALIRSEPAVLVDMFERLPSPFGLVRSGVAPDHPKLKKAIGVYQKLAGTPEFRFFGNVKVGRDVSVEELRNCYHAVVFACGAETDRKLGIPGEDLPGSHAATEFVGWYNGHPDYRDLEFDLSHDSAVIIGQGNVAVDICRILAKTVDELNHSDIAKHALDVLAESKVCNIHMIGRRSPAQAKFTHQELREFGELTECEPVVNPKDLELNEASREELADRNNRANLKSFEVLKSFAARPPPASRRRCRFHFLKSPLELKGEHRLERVVLARNLLEGKPSQQIARATEELEELTCGLVFRSIGYRGVPIPGVPFDEGRGVFPNRDGRIVDGESVVPGLYATGWIKRGPTGIIGTNRADSVATVKALLEDLPNFGATEKSGADGLKSFFESRGVRVVSYEDWQKIDSAEMRRGEAVGKPREKFTRVEEMLSVLDQSKQGQVMG
jgi:ferredoxin--NADP+ reductase